MGELLENIKMDKVYVRGEGCYLYDSEGNKYLDCIASFGALPFGYNNPGIWECIMEFYRSGEPSFVQPSALSAAGELARRLIEIAPQGLKYVTFTNSGAETVEAGIKLCRSATGRMGILAARNSFHGKTLGALSATGKSSYQAPFGAPVKDFNYVNFGDLDSLEEEFKSNPGYYAAFIVEPIQGEGGIVEPPSGYLKGVKDICSKYKVPLIVDEIQTGFGRTGDMFVCDREGICPDVLLLSKALGGGIIPIGACISSEDIYNEDFAMKHSSTFAANSLACRVGIKVLDMLKAGIADGVLAKGETLKTRFMMLKEKYPHIVKSIRGRGLMLGVEFGISRDAFPETLIGIMAEQEFLTPVISSYLLNVGKIRVAPTLNGNNVIRIEPPLIMNEKECSIIPDKIEEMLEVINSGNTARFLSFLVGTDVNRDYKTFVSKPKEKILPSEDEGRFAFLVHPVDIKNYKEFDESLSAFNEIELKSLADTWNDMVEPFVISSMKVASKCGSKAYGEFIAVPKTAEQFMSLPKDEAVAELKSALDLAKKRGAKIVGLGAYTSIVSGGGLYIKDEGIPLTTGNSYTVVSAVDAIVCAMERMDKQPEHSIAAVMGAAGSIGRGISILMSEYVSKLILIGSARNKKSSFDRLYRVAAEVYRYLSQMIERGKKFKHESIGQKLSVFRDMPKGDSPIQSFIEFAKSLDNKKSPIIISTEIDGMLPYADIVISATSDTKKLITPRNLKQCALVCDISKPGNVGEDVYTIRPDVFVIDGGVIEVPGRPSLGWNFGFDKGYAYACMSETMMLALEKHYVHTSLGASGVSLDSILYMRELSKIHGFKLAGLKNFNQLLPEGPNP